MQESTGVISKLKTARDILDEKSLSLFKGADDSSLQRVSIQHGITVVLNAINLVRGRPFVALTKGNFTKLGSGLTITAIVLNAPVALMAAYELHRRKHRGSYAHLDLDELQRLVRSGNVSRIEEARRAMQAEDPRTWHGDVYTAANDPRRFGSD